MKSGLSTWVTMVPMKMVCPSAGARAAASAPIAMLPPRRLSTTTGWPSPSESLVLIWRARISGGLPGASGTMKRMGPDGASIALIHAGAGHAVRAVVSMAAHVFIEPICIESIRKAKHTFETTDLRERLGRYHREAAKTFYGWADVWTDPEFGGWDIRA